MTDNEKLSCLIDRPCTACKFHKEEGCSKWTCVFEEKSDVPERKNRMTNEEAIAILEKEADFLYGEDKPHNRTAFDMAIKALSVPEREKGEWIRWYEVIKYDGCSDHIPHCRCSNCLKEQDPHRSQFINFCPNCGADMRGKAE